MRRRLAGVVIAVCWLPMLLGEALYGDLDAFPLERITAHSGRFAAAALTELVAAVLVIPAVLGLVAVVRRRSPVLAALGGVASLPMAAGIGGFVQLHLVALEMTSENLDRAAMTTLAQSNLVQTGLWSIPTILVLVGMSAGLPLLVTAAWRVGIVSWVPVALVVAHVPVHLVATTQGPEVLGHLLLFAALAITGIKLFHHPARGDAR